MTFPTEPARHPGNDAHQMVLPPIRKWNVTSIEKCDWNLLLYNFLSEPANMNYGVEPSLNERKEEKGNVFVEKEVFLLSQSGTLFRRSHTRKSWMGVTFGKDFLESLSEIPQLINLNFPNVFNWDHTLKSISNGGLSLFKCSQLKNLLWESLIKEFQLDQVYFPRYLYPLIHLERSYLISQLLWLENKISFQTSWKGAACRRIMIFHFVSSQP